MIICLYVNDLLTFTSYLGELEKTKPSSKFFMKDMGETDIILGIKIVRDNEEVCLTQSHYIKKVLWWFKY